MALRCFRISGGEFPSRPPPNNGMHPTADTPLVMFQYRCGAAGDWRALGRCESRNLMKVQRAEILNQLPRHGWGVVLVEDYGLEWWADERWLLESTWSPVRSLAYITFLVDPQMPHSRTRKKGEAIWAVMASPTKPNAWQSSEGSLTLSLGLGWEKRLPDFFDHLAALRNYQGGVSGA